MNYSIISVCRISLILFLSVYSLLGFSQPSYNTWEQNFQNVLQSGDVELIKGFFTNDFGEKEIESWKYELKRGNLNFKASRVIQLNQDALLLYIPTNNIPYVGDNHNEYFDFIYRVYKVENISGSYLFTERIMDEIKPDFINYQLDVKVNPKSRTFFFDCDITLESKTPYLILKLAKEFEIENIEINGSKVNYKRLGYLMHCNINTIKSCQLHIKGHLKSPETNNQFISMNNNSFFIRFGGFAAIPSPPPSNSGRRHFSEDSTHFEITYNYPNEFTLLQYGNSTESFLPDGRKQTRTIIDGSWMDDIAFYAQNNWDKKEIVNGNTHIGFYFNKKDEKERDFIIDEVDTLLQWVNSKFDNYGNFNINFVVLDNFVKGGLLNDSYSIVAQNAEIIGSGGIGYLHEICHSAPQPTIAGNYLWIKEGFTNFLSYEYLFSQKKEDKVWKSLKRKYLHCFDLYEEPLINIRSTSVPTYWAAYSKASYVFRMLETEIGKDNFQKALHKLGAMEGIELKDNRSYMELFEQVSEKNLAKFEEQWIYRKVNPVLTVQGQLERKGNSSLVKIRVLQKEPYFCLPLEVEIKTKNKTYRETIKVQGKETIFKMPVRGKEAAIKYDPESRLFAIIKDNKKTFTEGCNITIPIDTANFVSQDGSLNTQVWFTKTKNRVKIFKKDNNKESILELTNKLSPINYTINRDTIFIQDIDKKTIKFKNRQFDIAEPIYPKEFIPFLFSMVNYYDNYKLSLLYLNPGSLDCQVINCELEKISGEGFEFVLKKLLSDEKIYITSKNGYPKSFNTLDGIKCYISE